MPSFEILKPGLFTTIQDRGRPGFQKFGVSVAGAMDFFALLAGNRLVANEDSAAAVECTILGPSLRFLVDTTIAITGGDLSAQLDGETVAMWTSIPVRKGSVLSFGECRHGCRAYIAFAGGIDVPLILGSRSTHTRSHLGGLEGRALKKGDVLSTFNLTKSAVARRFRSSFVMSYLNSRCLRYLPGPQVEGFEVKSVKAFAESRYRVSNNSDRMGIRLEGEILHHRGRADIVSEAVPFGSIQVPANGQPIILTADRQTAGGYPKIGVVITADSPVLGQLKPGNMIGFVPVTEEEALKALTAVSISLSEGLQS